MEYTKKYAQKMEEERDMLLEKVKSLETRADWPSEIHEQYLSVLNQRDELQVYIDKLEECLETLRDDELIKQEFPGVEQYIEAVLKNG